MDKMKAILIEKRNNLQESEITLTEYITSNYMYTVSSNGDYLYIKESNMIYHVDHNSMNLRPMDFDLKKTQVEQIKKILPESSITYTKKSETSRICKIDGRNTHGVIKADIGIRKIPELADTCFADSYEFSQQFGIFEIILEPSEFIDNMEMHINIEGSSNYTNSRTIKVEMINWDNIVENFEQAYTYSVIS